MSEPICTCHCGGSMFYRHMHAESCELSRVGEEAPKSELEQLREDVARLTKERDEADRRAGAAERELQSYKEDKQVNDRWLDRAKDDWGVHRHTSFDVIWAQCLEMHTALAALPLVEGGEFTVGSLDPDTDTYPVYMKVGCTQCGSIAEFYSQERAQGYINLLTLWQRMGR